MAKCLLLQLQINHLFKVISGRYLQCFVKCLPDNLKYWQHLAANTKDTCNIQETLQTAETTVGENGEYLVMPLFKRGTEM